MSNEGAVPLPGLRQVVLHKPCNAEESNGNNNEVLLPGVQVMNDKEFTEFILKLSLPNESGAEKILKHAKKCTKKDILRMLKHFFDEGIKYCNEIHDRKMLDHQYRVEYKPYKGFTIEESLWMIEYAIRGKNLLRDLYEKLEKKEFPDFEEMDEIDAHVFAVEELEKDVYKNKIP